MFSFIEEYKLREDLFEGKGIEKVMKYPHHFYTPYPADLPKALETFNPFPFELKVFYEQIGFGFMHRRKGKINRLLDPVSLILVNLRQEECRYDKDLEKALSLHDTSKQLLFFQSDKGEYIAINRRETNGCNSVFYKQSKLAASLLEFITSYHKNDYWLDDMLYSAEPCTSEWKEKKTLEEEHNLKPNKRRIVGSWVELDKW